VVISRSCRRKTSTTLTSIASCRPPKPSSNAPSADAEAVRVVRAAPAGLNPELKSLDDWLKALKNEISLD
jgi:hypothetical protein